MRARWLVLPAVCILSMTTLCEQKDVALPNSRPGKLMAEWLQLCQSPDLERFTTWASENSSAEGLKRGPAAMRAQIYRSDCAANGGFRLGAQIGGVGQKRAARKLLSNNDAAVLVKRNQVKRRLADVDTDGRNVHVMILPHQ